MAWQFYVESTVWRNPSIAMRVLGCFLLSIMMTGGTLLVTKFLLDLLVGQ